MNLLRNFATVGAFTMLSRVLGFIRDILIAAFFGAGPVADAFFVAFKLPNLFRRLFAEGAFNSAFVPLYARSLEEGGEPVARRFAEEALSGLLVVLLTLTILAEIFAPLLVWVLAPGFQTGDPDKAAMTVLFTRICFPYLAAMSLVAYLSGILNTRDRFAAAAFAPVLLNLVLIGTLLLIGALGLGASLASGVMLSWGVFAAGIVQALMLFAAVRRSGVRLTLRRPRWTPGLRRLVRLGVPGIAAGGITQINIMAGTIIASFWPSAVSYLYYADRLYQLPLGVVGIAIGVALLPDLSRRLRSGDVAGGLDTQNRALEFAMLLTLPAAIALLVMPHELISVLFQRGAFDAEDARLTAWALAAYGLGLPAFVLIKVLSPAFFAREDTRTPMWFAGAGMLVNVAGSILLGLWLQHIGIALATSLAGWVNAALLFGALRRRGDFVRDDRLVKRSLAIAAASLVMAAGLAVLVAILAGSFASSSLTERIAALVAATHSGAAIYLGVLHLSGVVDHKRYVRMVLSRRPRPAG
jgi:putative peptidoglycan lipid II flippase